MLRQETTILTVTTQPRRLENISAAIAQWVGQTGMGDGLLTAFCQHTSASLLVQENASPDVLLDIAHWLDKLAPESDAYFHRDEGRDDMPAHLRTILTGVSVQIPVMQGQLALGTWQGIYLAEHRRTAHRRRIALHLIGE